MDKEDLLLKNFSILSKNPRKNADALESTIEQMLAANPKLALRCWEECIEENMSEIKQDFGKAEFSYDNIGRTLIWQYEAFFCSNKHFEQGLDVYAKNKPLLDIIYTKSPMNAYIGADYSVSYLIRKGRLQEADNILSAIYKNKVFSSYSILWGQIINKFRYGDLYHPSIYIESKLIQPENICNFCLSWIERIKDEEEKAGAMTYALQIIK